jgi:hypothetical protein
LHADVTNLSNSGDAQQQILDLLLQTPEFKSKNPILGTLRLGVNYGVGNAFRYPIL